MGEEVLYIVSSTAITDYGATKTYVGAYDQEEVAAKAVEILDQSSPENHNEYRKYKAAE